MGEEGEREELSYLSVDDISKMDSNLNHNDALLL